MSRHALAVVTLLATATVWGATFTLIKDVLTQIAPEPFIALRFLLAGVLLFVIAVARREFTGGSWRFGAVLGAFVFLGYWMQTHGLRTISPSRSAFLTAIFVVLVPFCDAVLYRTRVPLRAWIATAIALLGTALLLGGFAERPSFGDALTLACALMFALHMVFTAKWSASQPPVPLAATQVLVTGMAAIPASLFAPRPPLTPFVIGAIVFTAVFGTALAFVGLMWGQSRVSATEAAVILSFEPVAAALTSIFWLGERPTLHFIIGALLILGAVLLSQWTTVQRST